jgi:hypothetical protein
MIKIVVSFAFIIILVPARAQQAKVYEQNQKWGLLGADAKPVTKPIYDQIVAGAQYHIVKRYDIARARFFTGCIDGAGKIIVPLSYADLTIEGLRIIACQKSQQGYVYGLLSLNNDVLIPLQYSGIKSLGSLRFAVENKEGKIAMFSEEGKQLTHFTINAILPLQKDVSIFQQDGLMGVIDRNGIVTIKPEYTNIEMTSDGTLLGRKPHRWVWLNKDNQEVKSLHADSISLVGDGVYRIRKANKYYLTDRSLSSLCQPLDYIGETAVLATLATGRAAASAHNGSNNSSRYKKIRMGVIDVLGKQLLPNAFDSIHVDSLFIYAKSTRGWLLYSHQGALLNERGYEAFKAGNRFTYVQKNNFWGAVHTNGKEQIACVYDSILENNDQQFVVTFKDNTGIISSTEEWLVVPQRHMLQLVNNERYLIKDGDLTILKDFNHKTLYFTNNAITLSADGLIEDTSYGERWHVTYEGIVTKIQQKPTVEATVVEAESEGYRAIKKDGKWGFVDSQGRLRIANRYDAVLSFSEGLAAFSILKKWGFINNSDKIIIQPSYEEVGSFSNSLSIVKQKGRYGILAKKGKLALPCRYDSIKLLPGGYFELINNSLKGLADSQGVLQYEPKYHQQRQVGSTFIVQRGTTFGVIDITGGNVIPTMYDYIFAENPEVFVTMKRSNLEILN